jgi:CDP-glycerol glycerophosphotransferase
MRIVYYRACMTLPMDRDLVVYAAYWFGAYDCNPRAIYEKARELAPQLHGVWVVRKEAAASVPADVDRVVDGSWRQLRVMARAGVLVNNVNFPHHTAKRRGSLHVQTQHGTPLKTVGFDLREFPVAAAGMNFERLAENCARWDVLISPNPHSSEVWRRAYPGHYRILEAGYPRNDLLVEATEEQIASIRTGLDIKPEQITVLYAPTHRDGQTRFRPPLDLAQWAKELGPDHTVLVRAHYFYRESVEPACLQKGPEGAAQILDVTGHPDVRELCLAADVLVTDYSAIMFDYAALARPIVIFAPDWDAYLRARGTYFDLLEEPPGAVTTTPEELARIFTSRAYQSASACEALNRFRSRFCPHDDGHAAERVVRQVLLGGRDRL